MALCSSSCNIAVPRWSGGCNIQTRDGGIDTLIFLSCNYKFATVAEGAVDITTPTGSVISVGLITDNTSWSIGVQNNMVRPSPEGLGEKPEPSQTLTRFSSCRPEEIESTTHNVNFQSFDVDVDNLFDRTYWNTICTDFGAMRLIYRGCNGLIYFTGDVSDPGFRFTPQVLNYIHPQLQDNKGFYQVNLSFLFECIPVPLDIVGLDDALEIDVNS